MNHLPPIVKFLIVCALCIAIATALGLLLYALGVR